VRAESSRPGLKDTLFRFTCFEREDPDDPNIGLIDGELAIPGRQLREHVFDPVIGLSPFSNQTGPPFSDRGCC
jgi:hypothetical protein